MSDWAETSIGVAAAVGVSAAVYLLLRTRILRILERARLADIEADAVADRYLPAGVVAHRRGITNIGAFRAYAEAYVRNGPGEG